MSQQTIQLNREEWRTWLAQNHDKTDQVWLLFYKKHVNKKGITLEEAVEEAISFGWIDDELKEELTKKNLHYAFLHENRRVFGRE